MPAQQFGEHVGAFPIVAALDRVFDARYPLGGQHDTGKLAEFCADLRFGKGPLKIAALAVAGPRHLPAIGQGQGHARRPQPGCDGALRDPVIAALRQRVQVTEDPAMSAVAPRLRPARVTVALTDGRQVTRSGDSQRGDFQQPFTEAEIRAKFRELAGVVLTPEGVSRVEDAADRCEDWESIAALTQLLRRHGRP